MKSCKAFSLIELLICTAILAILFLLSVPSLKHKIQTTRMEQSVMQITNAINFARSLAITNNAIATLCKSKSAAHCDGEWSDGQIIIMKNKIVKIYPKVLGVSLYWKGNLGKNDVLQFQSTGLTYGQDGSFILCAKDQQLNKRLVLNQAGRIRVETNIPLQWCRNET